MTSAKRKRARRKVPPVVRLRVRVFLPHGAGPWLYVNGEYACRGFGLSNRVAIALGFPRIHEWPGDPRFPTSAELAWYDALCYRIRGQYGAREITLPNATGERPETRSEDA